MKRNMLILVAMFCFLVLTAWSEAAVDPPKYNCRTTAKKPVLQPHTKKLESKDKKPCDEQKMTDQSAAPVLTPLSAQVPKGSTLVIVSSKDKTFETQNE